MIIAGVDPGRSGGLAAIDTGLRIAVATPMPLCDDGKTPDGGAVAAWLWAQEVDIVWVERLQARNVFNAAGKAIRKPGNEFRLATGYGKVLGACETAGIRHRLVQPVRWQSAVLGVTGDKQAAIAWVQQHYPQCSLIPGRCRTPQDGMADAVCIAAYGVKNMGEPVI